LVGSDRNDAGGIDVVVGDIIVPLDMVEIYGFTDAVGLVEIFKISEEVWVVDDSADIALKMAIVDRIEPYQGDKEPPVGLDELRPEEEPAGCKSCVKLIQRIE
jgi:hypothetical protein